MVDVRREHNQTLTINKIPVEILRKIFEAAAGDRSLSTVRPNKPVPPDPKNCTALRLAHVCHHWKAVAEGHLFLWNRIVVERGDGVELNRRFLRLAGNDAPLDVYIRWLCEVDRDFLDELGSRCGHLRRLHVADVDSDAPSLAIFSSDAPLLDSLCLIVTDDDLALPALFNRHMPALKHLTLGYVTKFSENNFSGLTQLRLFRQKYHRRSEFVAVLSVIRQSPALVELVMEGCDSGSRHFNDEDSDEDEDDDDNNHNANHDDDSGVFSNISQETISLPFLKRLSLKSCDQSMLALILGMLELQSPTLALNLGDVSSPDDCNIESLLYSDLRSSWASLQQDFTALHLSFDDEVYIIAGETTAVRVGDLRGDATAVRELIFSPQRLFQYGTLQALTLSCATRRVSWAGVHYWQDIFAHLVSLNKLFLRLSTKSYKLWLEALTTRQLGRRAYPAPALRALCITPPPSVDDDPNLVAFLLRNRHESGHRLRALHVVHDGAKESDDEEMMDGTFVRWRSLEGAWAQHVDELTFEKREELFHAFDVPAELDNWEWAARLIS